ncbi:integrase [Vibrio metoecus]
MKDNFAGSPAAITMVARVYGKWLVESNKKESERVWQELEKVRNQ